MPRESINHVENLLSWLTYLAAPILLGLVIVVLILAVLEISLLVRLGRMQRHYRLLTSDAQSKSLVALLEEYAQTTRETSRRVSEVDMLARSLERDGRSHVQCVAMVRFNPFRETGGDQSFALAMADADGNGAVISSLHSRDATRIYAKPLTAWQSSYPLTDEEQTAIQRSQA
jgi:hypothetical protein